MGRHDGPLTLMKRIVIVANGRLWKGITAEIDSEDYVIGVDRAAYWLLTQGVPVAAAVGDFDSTTPEELAFIKKNISDVRYYIPEKDFIDTELALQIALSQRPTEILIFGASGTRRDHELAVIGLLERCLRRGIPAEIRDETNSIGLVGRGRTILKGRAGMRYVSVIPVTNSIVISLRKFKYEITKKRILRGQTIGISNEILKTRAEIEVHVGRALVIQSRD